MKRFKNLSNVIEKRTPISMINAWSLAAEVLAGTLDETYPIINNEEEQSKSRGSQISGEGSDKQSDS